MDTLPPVNQVDGGDLARTVPDGEAAIIGRGPHRHRQPRQLTTDEPAAAPEANGALLSHLAHQILRPIDNGRPRLREDARTGLLSTRCAGLVAMLMEEAGEGEGRVAPLLAEEGRDGMAEDLAQHPTGQGLRVAGPDPL